MLYQEKKDSILEARPKTQTEMVQMKVVESKLDLAAREELHKKLERLNSK